MEQRQTVGIRELKQNPSEVIAKAANGVRFAVLSNGKYVGVVIQREAAMRNRWVSSDELTAMSLLARKDTTGWADENRAERELDNDPVVDPWDTTQR
jgi:antitoxin (DNA-binding transcriptional repressor) of toxin-antitoxin stability system